MMWISTGIFTGWVSTGGPAVRWLQKKKENMALFKGIFTVGHMRGVLQLRKKPVVDFPINSPGRS